MYTGQADWELIGRLKADPRGDTCDRQRRHHHPEAVKSAFETYGVDGIMIGRGAIGSPWIFREVEQFRIVRKL